VNGRKVGSMGCRRRRWRLIRLASLFLGAGHEVNCRQKAFAMHFLDERTLFLKVMNWFGEWAGFFPEAEQRPETGGAILKATTLHPLRPCPPGICRHRPRYLHVQIPDLVRGRILTSTGIPFVYEGYGVRRKPRPVVRSETSRYVVFSCT